MVAVAAVRALPVSVRKSGMKYLLRALLLGLLVGHPVTAGAGSLTLLGVGAPAAVAGNQITLDGDAAGTTGSSSTATVTLTTTKTNDFIVLCVQVNSTGVSTVADVAGLTWTQIGAQTGTMFCYRSF